jgi:tRNA-Thr(GGU) m(6)t(6)A37 methyltransferase TsaA
MSITFKAIGIIKSPFKTLEGMPIQSKAAKGIRGTIEIKKKYREGLKDLDGFSHIYLIYHLHKSKGYNLTVIPFLDTISHGVFATRAPKRPNSIGLSVVKLLNISDGMIEIEDVDILDGTPLIDIKPYTAKFDHFDSVKNGWIEAASGDIDNAKSDNRFN